MIQEDKPIAEVLSTQVEAWQREVSALQEKIAFAIGKPCSQHPDAPHGFDRNASHNAGRYVCECEGWEPVAAQVPFCYMSDQFEVGLFTEPQTDPVFADMFPVYRNQIDAQAKITEQAARIKALEAEAADRESFLKTLADTCTEAERIAIERAGRIDAMESECRKLRDALSEAEAFCKRKDITIECQRKVVKLSGQALTEVQDLIAESRGVYGLHLNGDKSPWNEIEQGGWFERLVTLPEALAAIAEHEKGVG